MFTSVLATAFLAHFSSLQFIVCNADDFIFICVVRRVFLIDGSWISCLYDDDDDDDHHHHHHHHHHHEDYHAHHRHLDHKERG